MAARICLVKLSTYISNDGLFIPTGLESSSRYQGLMTWKASRSADMIRPSLPRGHVYGC